MMELILTRVTEFQDACFGLLCINGEPICVTLEPAWEQNKIAESCIPVGSYPLEWCDSLKFGRCLRIGNVEGRHGIIIHPGNKRVDTKGCILPGKGLGTLDGEKCVTESTTTWMLLNSRVQLPATLHIIDGRQVH